VEQSAPTGIDPDKPSPARIYDYYLGGTHNFAADRAVGDAVMAAMPQARLAARVNRAFLGRAVRMVTAAGVDQFLDLGSGIPTEGPLHALAPDARVVYVDIDPVAVIHSRAILGEDDQAEKRTAVVQADLHDAAVILDAPDVRRLIDFGRPVCLVLLASLHFAPDSPALRDALRRYRDAVPDGSHLIISHVTSERRPEQIGKVRSLYNQTSAPLVARDSARLAELLAGWAFVAPGIVDGPCWRPDPGEPPPTDSGQFGFVVGVAKRLPTA
jgi:hypothetical protein